MKTVKVICWVAVFMAILSLGNTAVAGASAVLYFVFLIAEICDSVEKERYHGKSN